MLTKNGKMVFGNNGGGLNYKTMDGNLNNNTGVYFQNEAKIAVGTGTTAPTLDDYIMQNELNTLTLVSNVNTLPTEYASADFLQTITSVYQNNTSADITVTELGVLMTVSSYSSSYTILAAHEIIDPVVIHAGETKTFTIKIG